MFTVIYRFSAKVGFEDEFQKLWHEGTKLIREERKSLGSRLHKSSEGSFVAYAQWPTYESWKSPVQSSSRLTDVLRKMSDCLIKSEVLFELDVIDDLIENE